MAHHERQEHRGMLMSGLIVLGVGVVFLLRNLGYIPGFDVVWPVFPILVGIGLIVSALFGGRSSSSS